MELFCILNPLFVRALMFLRVCVVGIAGNVMDVATCRER